MTKENLKIQVADICCCYPGELDGESVREVLESIDTENIQVFWGCISEKTLNSNF